MDESALKSFVADSIKTQNFRLIPLAGDASARRYYRVADAEEKTWVLMSWEPFKAAEYPFLSVHTLFKDAGVTVPEVVGVSETGGLILLEDLGDLTLERKFWENQTFEPAKPFYEKALDELLKIHFATLKSKVSSTAHRLQFDTEKFMWEFNYTREHLIEKMGQIKLTPAQDTLLQKTFRDISERLHQEPKWITHRDYHSRNLMIKFDEVRVIDFQDARGGPLQYDLVSLLRDSYVTLADADADLLLHTFYDEAKKNFTKPMSLEHFQLMYELQTVQRCFKACGSFSSFWNARQDTRYLKHIQPTLKRVMKALYSFPEYREFSGFLLDSGLLERKYE
ncbi:MAG: phosphotransferase [Bdellovibrionaceae bacterium]|nr:phosphotransferase [Pseudobdellovibrionaceae bacterium]